jgi:hypothetical protein
MITLVMMYRFKHVYYYDYDLCSHRSGASDACLGKWRRTEFHPAVTKLTHQPIISHLHMLEPEQLRL